MTSLAVRVRGEYTEMPGLRLTVRQAARLFSVSCDVADAVLHELRRASILALSDDGAFSLIAAPSRRHLPRPRTRDAAVGADDMSTPGNTVTTIDESLRDASLERLICLRRHWTWADEAKARFEQELADGWNDDEPMSDRPFGAYYHWCALMCAFGEAALDHGLLSPPQLEPIRQDVEAALPGLRACRQLLVVIPPSLEERPRIVDMIRENGTLPRLRRVHQAFGDALRHEQLSREIDSLDP